MHTYMLRSSFKQLPIELFVYPATWKKRGTVFFLKGLYSAHNPQDSSSLEAELIKRVNSTYTVACVNTARLPHVEGADAFVGKTFAKECEDVNAAYTELFARSVCTEGERLFVIGNSFGGTTVLGVPDLIRRAEMILMIGSGCGKSPTTTKPLVQTLPEKRVLLRELRKFTGTFIFVRGGKDTVVPRSSQDNIIAAVHHARLLLTCLIAEAGHNLIVSEKNGVPFDRANFLAELLTLAEKS